MRRWLCALLSLAAGTASADSQQFFELGDFELVNGETVRECRIGYRRFGPLDDDRANIVVMPTWFNGTTQHLVDYGYVGDGSLLDSSVFHVILIDSLGNGVSCSPSNHPTRASRDFPEFTILDMVRSQHRLLKHLGFDEAYAVAGVSMGAMQALQWMAAYPTFFDRAIVIDGSPRLTGYGLLQMRNFKKVVRTLQASGHDEEDIIDLLSDLTQTTLYTPNYFRTEVGRDKLSSHLDNARDYFFAYDSDNYVAQIDALTSFSLTDGTDASLRRIAQTVKAKTLIIGNASDHMVHPAPARRLAEAIGATYLALDSHCGHLGSTCERGHVVDAVRSFLSRQDRVDQTQPAH